VRGCGAGGLEAQNHSRGRRRVRALLTLMGGPPQSGLARLSSACRKPRGRDAACATEEGAGSRRRTAALDPGAASLGASGSRSRRSGRQRRAVALDVANDDVCLGSRRKRPALLSVRGRITGGDGWNAGPRHALAPATADRYRLHNAVHVANSQRRFCRVPGFSGCRVQRNRCYG
jgi:hypothetical protein